MLQLTDHVERRMTERGIDVLELEAAWAQRITALTAGSRSDTVVFDGRTPSGQVLRIVVAADDETRIVSVWRLHGRGGRDALDLR